MTVTVPVLSSTLNRDLVRPFVDLNYGLGRYPKLVIAVDEPEDTAALVDAVVKLVPLGLQVEQSVLRDKLDLLDPDDGRNYCKRLHRRRRCCRVSTVR